MFALAAAALAVAIAVEGFFVLHARRQAPVRSAALDPRRTHRPPR